MIITCPACSRRYIIDPESLGAQGRDVRCSGCSNAWHQDPASDMPESIELVESVSVIPTEPKEGAAKLPTAPTMQQKRPLVWLVITILATVFIGGGMFARDHIVRYFPTLEPFYELIGLQITTRDMGFELRNLLWERDPETTLPILRGEIRNSSSTARKIPSIRITFQNAEKCETNDCTLAQMVENVGDERILPGDTISFQIGLKNPVPNGTKGVFVEFHTP